MLEGSEAAFDTKEVGRKMRAFVTPTSKKPLALVDSRKLLCDRKQ